MEGGPELPPESVPDHCTAHPTGDGECHPHDIGVITIGDDEREGTSTNPAGRRAETPKRGTFVDPLDQAESR